MGTPATITEIMAITDEDVNGDHMFGIWATTAEEVAGYSKFKVLAKKEDRWGEGDMVEVEVRSLQKYPGPDNEEGWAYAGFKKPGMDKGGQNFSSQSGRGGGFRKPGSQPQATPAARAPQPLTQVSIMEASAVYDDLLKDSQAVGLEGAVASARAGALFEAWAQGKAVTLTTSKGNGKIKEEETEEEEDNIPF